MASLDTAGQPGWADATVSASPSSTRSWARDSAVLVGGIAVVALPLIGLVSLLLRSELDPHIENYRLHFVVFGIAGAVAFVLGYTAGEAANRRGDARVLLLSLAFMATGGFMGLHAAGTQGVLFSKQLSGFQIAIPVGLLVSAVFAAGSAFVDIRPGIGQLLIRRRAALRLAVLLSMVAWFVVTVAELPPLGGDSGEAARGILLVTMAIVATVMYAASAARYWSIFRHDRTLLPAAVIACFVLLSEALIGVALTGERKWHASWWEWHALIVSAYLIIGLAVRRQWRDERFRHLYLSTTRERHQEISVLAWRPGRFHELRRALEPGRGGGGAQRLLGDCGASDHARLRRRAREVHRRRLLRRLQQPRRSA